jgi:hypothetical protein
MNKEDFAVFAEEVATIIDYRKTNRVTAQLA